MGWDYEDRVAFGVNVCAWKYSGLKHLLKEYNTWLDCDKDMAFGGKGNLFIYIKSSYQTLDEDEGVYAFSSPDTTGDEFNPPKHPIVHEQLIDKEPYVMTDEEKLALNKVREFCDINSDPVWVRHTLISY